MTLLERAHAAGAKLTPESSAAEMRDALALYVRACWPDGRALAPGTVGWLVGDLLPRWMEARAGAAPTRVLYFGCDNGQAGHTLREVHGRSVYRSLRDGLLPWGLEVDGKLCPPGAQVEGRAAVHHKDGWTALAFWDRSVDGRGNSNSAFLIDATLDFPDALEAARAAWPRVFARFGFEVVPA